MGLFDDFEPEEGPEGEEPLPGYHQARSRRVIQVDPVAITGTPEGTGSIRTRGGSHVEEDAALEGLFEKEAPAAPPTQQAYRDAVRAREDASEPADSSWLRDFGEAVVLPHSRVTHIGDGGGERRTERRLSRVVEDVSEDPLATLLGAAEGGSQHLLSETAGGLFQTPELRAGQSGSRAGIARESRPAHSYAEVRDAVQEEVDDARERSPYGFGASEAVGGLASAMALAPLEGAQAATWGGRMLQGTRAGMLYGGGNALGASEHTLAEEPEALFQDGAIGSLEGGVGGALFSGGGEGVRRLGRAGTAARTAADRARVAAVGGGASPSIGDRLMREFEEMPGGTTGQAARIRRLGIVGPADRARDILQRADAAVEQTGNEGVLGRVIAQIEESGERIPVRDLVRQFEAVATRMEQNPELAPYAAVIRRRGEQWARTFGGVVEGEAGPMSDLSATVEPRRVREALGTMRDTTQWLDPVGGQLRPPVEASRDLHRSLSRARDSWVDDVLGEGAGRDYREARLDLGTAMQSQEAAEQAVQRAARARGISMTDYLTLQAGASSGSGGPMQAVGSMLLNRAWRGREGALRATATEGLARLLEAGGASRVLGEYGPILQRALERGGPALAATHYVLSTTDPGYRERIEELEASQDDGEDEVTVPGLFDDFEAEDAAPPQ